MAIDTGIWSKQQFGVAIQVETAVGTKTSNAMLRINNDDIVWLNQPLIQEIGVKSGGSRVHDKKDIYVSDYGSRCSVQVPMILESDTALYTILHENVMGATTGSAPAAVALVYNYTSAEMAVGTAASGNLYTLTLQLISPEAGEAIWLVGAVCTHLDVSLAADADGGRRHATATFETLFRPLDGAAIVAPTTFGTTYRYLRDLTTKKQVGGVDVIMNKLEYSIDNPLSTAGMTSDGFPEVMTRGMNEGAVATGTIGIKYDANTASFWQLRRAGTTVAVELSNHTTWASSSFGLLCNQAAITSEITPTATDSGAFIDLGVEFLADVTSTKNVLDIVP